MLFIQMIYKHIIHGIFPNIAENFLVNEFVSVIFVGYRIVRVGYFLAVISFV